MPKKRKKKDIFIMYSMYVCYLFFIHLRFFFRISYLNIHYSMHKITILLCAFFTPGVKKFCKGAFSKSIILTVNKWADK